MERETLARAKAVCSSVVVRVPVHARTDSRHRESRGRLCRQGFSSIARYRAHPFCGFFLSVIHPPREKEWET
jgi:hypothetical protein